MVASLTSTILLLKYDKDNHLLWEHTWDSGNHDFGNAVAVGTDGVYVVGCKYTCNGYQGVIVKFSKDGAYQWDREWGGTGFLDSFGDVAVGPDDNIYVVGNKRPVLDAVLVKYDKDGNVLNSVTWGGAGDDRGYGILCHIQCSLHLRSDGTCNNVPSEVQLQPRQTVGYHVERCNWIWQHCSRGREHLRGRRKGHWRGAEIRTEYLCKFTDGAPHLPVGGPRSTTPAGTMDSAESRPWATTSTSQDGREHTDSTRSDLILLKYDSSGTKLWQKNWGERDVHHEDTYDAGGDVAIGSDGIYVAGCTSAPGTDIWDALLIKYISTKPTATAAREYKDNYPLNTI